MLLLDRSEPNQHVQTAVFRRCRVDAWNSNPRSAFLFRLETQQEHAMPYLFWAVLPFALMDTWWGMCEDRRDTE